MGALLALPEFIGAAIAGGAEALEIAGSVGAVLSGEGLATLQSIEAAAAALGAEGAVASEAVTTVLTLAPQVYNSLLWTGAAAAEVGGAGASYALASQYTGHHVYGTSGGSGSGLSGAGAGAAVLNSMELVPVAHHGLEGGIPGVPDWLLNLLPELPDVPQMLSRIAHGIWTSYYNAGSMLIQRGLSEEMERLLRELSEGAARAVSQINWEDPVNALASRLRALQNFRTGRETTLLLEGRPIDIGQAVQAVKDTASSVSNALYDTAQLPVDGFNALGDGIRHLGQWIFMPGPVGGTLHSSVPSWMWYVLDETDGNHFTAPRKHEEGHPYKKTRNEKAAKTARSNPKTSKTNKKRRSRSTKLSTSRRKHRI